MWWPFKRTPVVPMEEIVKDKPMPACGDKVKHYNLRFQGAPCFDCAAIRARNERDEAEERLATLIATKVAAILKRD